MLELTKAQQDLVAWLSDKTQYLVDVTVKTHPTWPDRRLGTQRLTITTHIRAKEPCGCRPGCKAQGDVNISVEALWEDDRFCYGQIDHHAAIESIKQLKEHVEARIKGETIPNKARQRRTRNEHDRKMRAIEERRRIREARNAGV